jgi:hypothetical protein
MKRDEVTRLGSLGDDDLPAGFSTAKAKGGRTYYIDHNTKTTSWTHPRGVKLTKPLSPDLPHPYERDVDERGRAYYLNHETHTTSWLNPLKLDELRAMGVIDAEMDDLVADGRAGDEWPWIVKEIIKEGPHRGEVYWVNYRQGPRGGVDNRSPEDKKAGYLATAHIRAARESKDDAGRSSKL